MARLITAMTRNVTRGTGIHPIWLLYPDKTRFIELRDAFLYTIKVHYRTNCYITCYLARAPCYINVHGSGGWILFRVKTVIANSNNRTMSCLKGRLLVLVHQKKENVRIVFLECRLMKAHEEKGELA